MAYKKETNRGSTYNHLKMIYSTTAYTRLKNCTNKVFEFLNGEEEKYQNLVKNMKTLL